MAESKKISLSNFTGSSIAIPAGMPGASAKKMAAKVPDKATVETIKVAAKAVKKGQTPSKKEEEKKVQRKAVRTTPSKGDGGKGGKGDAPKLPPKQPLGGGGKKP